MLTHVPKNPFCTTCTRSKMQAKPAPNRKGKRSDGGEKPKGFGTEVTADHFIAKDEIDQSIAGEKVGLVIHCRGSDWLDLYPCPTNDAGSAETAFIHFQGSKDEIKSFYSDDSRELKKAAVNRGWLQDDSTPGRPDTNGDAEVSVRRILEGTRCALEHAGMAPGWWMQANTLPLHTTLLESFRETTTSPHTRHGTPNNLLLVCWLRLDA